MTSGQYRLKTPACAAEKDRHVGLQDIRTPISGQTVMKTDAHRNTKVQDLLTKGSASVAAKGSRPERMKESRSSRLDEIAFLIAVTFGRVCNVRPRLFRISRIVRAADEAKGRT